MLIRLMLLQRFWPLFWTQFLGAFNDNFFKNALVILITFRAVRVAGIPPEQMVAFSAAVFILPYLFVSGVAGEIADKIDKARVIRLTKLAEIGIMLVGAAGLLIGSVPLLMVVLFFMGLQSATFGPCKYAVLPQHLGRTELVAGNALIEMGTYLAILLGTIVGGLLINVDQGDQIVAAGVVLVALTGAGAARFIPAAPSFLADLEVRWDPIRPTIELVQLAARHRPIWLAILGISWFWTLGSLFLSIFPAYTKDTLGGDESLATLFLAMFSVGIGVGSLMTDWLSKGRVELGLVPVGAIGMTWFTFDLWLVGQPWPPPAHPDAVFTAWTFLSTVSGLRIAFDLAMLSVFGGFMIVPLYSYVQWRAAPEEVARIIAGNNIVNSIWMITGSLLLMASLSAGLDAVDMLLMLAVLNVAVAVYMYSVVPEYLLRFAAWVLSFVVYRLRVAGEAHVPRDGACVLVCNHVSFIDWFVIMAAVRRPIRFVMYHRFMKLPLLSFLFRQNKVIPIAGRKEDPALLDRAMDTIHEELQEGWMVCIFPEGDITRDGAVQDFRSGIERIVERDPVPVVPAAIHGLWGSFFSRKGGSAMTRPFRRVWSRVWVTFGPPVAAADVTAEGLQETVEALRQSQGAA